MKLPYIVMEVLMNSDIRPLRDISYLGFQSAQLGVELMNL